MKHAQSTQGEGRSSLSRLLTLCLLGAAFATPAVARPLPRCTAAMTDGTRCRVAVGDVLPTQLTYGEIEVERRAEKIGRMNDDKLEEYLEEHEAPLVVSPAGDLYLLDRHHLSLALASLWGDRVDLIARIKHNWRSLRPHQFWERMQADGALWLYDVDGNGPLTIADLPASIFDLQDDPLRALAWGVQKEDGYEETDIPHADFIWGNFLRDYVSADDVRDDFDAAVEIGLKISQSRVAKDLPGYNGRHK